MQARERGLRVYETAFEVLPTPIAVLDHPSGRILRANGLFATLHGYEASELSDSLATNLMEATEVAKFERAARKAHRESKSLDTTLTRRRKDGTTFSSRVVLSGGGETWVLAVEA